MWDSNVIGVNSAAQTPFKAAARTATGCATGRRRHFADALAMAQIGSQIDALFVASESGLFLASTEPFPRFGL